MSAKKGRDSKGEDMTEVRLDKDIEDASADKDVETARSGELFVCAVDFLWGALLLVS